MVRASVTILAVSAVVAAIVLARDKEELELVKVVRVPLYDTSYRGVRR